MNRGFSERIGQELEKIAASGLERRLVGVRFNRDGGLVVRGKRFLNLASNDYLGLLGEHDMIAGIYQGAATDPDVLRPGSGASRLMTGNHLLYERLEKGLAQMYGRQRALVFNSGYHLNIGLLPVLTTRNDLILADRLCHASLIDGMRLSRARLRRYPHLDYASLEEMLATRGGQYDQVFIVTESVFSMDGDLADLGTLVRLARQYGAVLYVDEAHAVGVCGEKGLGLAEAQGVVKEIDLLVGTFGKAWAGQGAFLLCSGLVADFLISRARSLMYTTALPPVTLNWLCQLLPKIEDMGQRRRHLFSLAERMRAALREEGLQPGGDSQIVPVIGGDSERVLQAADILRQQGYWTVAVRPPTVPAGTARLRLSLTAGMQWEDLAALPRTLARALGG